MRKTRVYTPQELVAGRTLSLASQASAHVVRVLRLRAGDEVVLFDGCGIECAATLLDANPKETQVVLGDPIARTVESPLRVLLMQCMAKGERMDFSVQKSVEMGIFAIQPLVCRHSVARVSGEQAEKKRRHWQEVAVSACEQCGRTVVPEVYAPRPFFDALADFAGIGVLLDGAGTAAFRDIPFAADTKIALVIGPEGGFDESEVKYAQDRGFYGVRLGPRVLRTETAALAALAAMQALAGDFV